MGSWVTMRIVAIGRLVAAGVLVCGSSAARARDSDSTASPASESRAPPQISPADELLELAAETTALEILYGGGQTSAGRKIAAQIASTESRRQVLFAILPFMLDDATPSARRDDAMRLVCAILARAHRDETLDSLIDDGDLGPALRSSLPIVHARAGALLTARVDDVVSPPEGIRSQTSRERALAPDMLLPQSLLILGHLRAEGEVRMLLQAARKLDANPALTPEMRPRLRCSSWGLGRFPEGYFAHTLGLLATPWSIDELLAYFRSAAEMGSAGGLDLQVAARAAQVMRGSHPELIDECRKLIERVPEPDENAPPTEDVENEYSRYQSAFSMMRAYLDLYIHLGVEHYRETGQLEWLDALLGWITKPYNAREPEIVTRIRGSTADTVLLTNFDPALHALLYARILPLVGTGPAPLNGHSFANVLGRIPPATIGAGADRRLAPSHLEAVGRLWTAADTRTLRDVLLGPGRHAGRWGRGTPLEALVRSALTREPFAVRAFAHILGAEGRAELEALRPVDGKFTGTLRPADAKERQRLLDMEAQPHTEDNLMHYAGQAFRGIDVPREEQERRLARFREECAPLLRVEEMEKYRSESAYRDAVLAKIRASLVPLVGDEEHLPPEADWQNFRSDLSMRHSLHTTILRTYDFDFNLTRALETTAVYERLASRDPGEVRSAIEGLARRRDDGTDDFTDLDVYAYVPELIFLFEDAPSRFDESRAVEIRRLIARTFASFRSVTAREFLKSLVADPATDSGLREYVESLRPSRLKNLIDEEP